MAAPNYGTDLDIGYPTKRSLSEFAEVQNFTEVTTELETLTQTLGGVIAEAVEELRKIKTGSGLAIGVDLDEEVE